MAHVSAVSSENKITSRSISSLWLLDRKLWSLAVGSIGVVYGDIGTSPIYALKEAVKSGTGAGLRIDESVLGVLSLIIWLLLLIVTLKYVFILLRADNNGEGGILSRLALGDLRNPIRDRT